MLHIKKDDEVKVLSGKARGQQGKVLRVFPDKGSAVVENLNFVKRHTRPNPQRNIKGGLVEREAPIHLSNLQVICRDCQSPTRVSFETLADGRKVRVCKKCGGSIDK